MKIENEYNPNTNQIGPKGLREERGLLKVCLMLALALILASEASLKPASNDSYKCHIYRHTTVKKKKKEKKDEQYIHNNTINNKSKQFFTVTIIIPDSFDGIFV